MGKSPWRLTPAGDNLMGLRVFHQRRASRPNDLASSLLALLATPPLEEPSPCAPPPTTHRLEHDFAHQGSTLACSRSRMKRSVITCPGRADVFGRWPH